MDRTRRIFSTLLVAAVLLALVPLAPPAAASSSYLCTGYVGCHEDGYSHFGYRKAGKKMWWRMYAGHNCTNYVAYRLVKGGMSPERPWSGTGMAYYWGRANRRITDGQPMVGAVAWWKKNAGGVGSSGHVAYVERVISGRKIVVSEDSWSGDFHWRTVTKGSGSWPTGFVHFDDRSVEALTRPSITGTPRVDQPLTASVGRWRPAADLQVQWLADGKPVAGATSTTYTPTAQQRGQRLSVRVEASTRGYVDGRATSARTPRVVRGAFARTAQPEIVGVPRVDQVLEVRPGTWAPTPETTSIQWLVDGKPVQGATGVQLKVRQEHIGQRITVRTTARSEGYRASSVTTESTRKVGAGRFEVLSPFAVKGVARMGRTLTVVPGEYRPADADLTYTWLRNGDRAGTGRSYRLGVDDVGERISLRVGLAHPGYRDRTVVLAGGSRVATTPVLRVAADGKRGRAVVRVRVAAPGVETATGKVAVRIGEHQVGGRLVDGRLRVVVDGLQAGTRTVKVAYLGTEIIRPGRTSATVKVRRPRD